MLHPTKEFAVYFDHDQNVFKEDSLELGNKKITQKGDTKLLFMSMISILEFTVLVCLAEHFMPKAKTIKNNYRFLRRYRTKYYMRNGKSIIWRVVMLLVILVVIYRGHCLLRTQINQNLT